MKHLILLVLSLCISLSAYPQLRVSNDSLADGVALGGRTILIDKNEAAVIKTAAGLFAEDYKLVTGNELKIADKPAKGNHIIAGTPESSFISSLVKKGLLDISPIKDGFERYLITIIREPFKKGTDAVVIVGNDARGTAYGLLSISEQMGVSPWHWWADVPVTPRQDVYIAGSYVSKSPSVRYRGIFINDEDWGLTPWAAKTYEPEIGNIGPRTYARVCELLLRLRANMLAPAMHTCSDAFYTHPENKEVADKYGIMITTSHCEPLLFNNASLAEWDSSVDGEWNYKTNRDVIYNKLDSRVKEAAPFENIYTMAMRGLHDEGMRGDMPLSEKVKVLHDAIMDQREILQKHIATPVEDIPQIFVPYKEAQQLYEAGLEVPEDITLVWPDDNYGYMKMLSNPADRKRSGRAGVYYHVSYLGVPHSYLWISTTPPMLIYEEMKKAYDTGADRYWLLNVGDIKPMELTMQFFFQLAWDFNSFNYNNVNSYQANFLAGIFGNRYRNRFQKLLDEYYRLAWSRKPEAMGWEREWDSPEFTGLKDTEFSFENYNDAQNRLADYSKLSDKAEEILKSLPEDMWPSFFEMIGYQVLASDQMNRKFLLSQLNHELAAKGDMAAANRAAELAVQANDSITALNKMYNSMLDGKWNQMMTVSPAICALNHLMPELTTDPEAGIKDVNLTPDPEKNFLEGCLYIPADAFSNITGGEKHSFRLLDGIGFDWKSLMMGEVTEPSFNPTDTSAPKVTYDLPRIDADSVTVILYTLPRFPLYKGAGTSFGVALDDSEVAISDFKPIEQSREWKDNVIRNAMITQFSFPIDRSADMHKLNIISGDPGLIIQRILVDWGGLKKTYVGPEPSVAAK